MMSAGKVIIVTGNGKGKTTTALGLGVKYAVAGKRVYMIQFLKGGGYSGELFATQYLPYFIEIKQFGFGCPIARDIKDGNMVCTKCGQCFRGNRDPENHFADKALAYTSSILSAGNADVIILDEISHAMRHGLLAVDSVVKLITDRPEDITVIMTGRSMPEKILALADEARECCMVKHPIAKGIDARRGIEY